MRVSVWINAFSFTIFFFFVCTLAKYSVADTICSSFNTMSVYSAPKKKCTKARACSTFYFHTFYPCVSGAKFTHTARDFLIRFMRFFGYYWWAESHKLLLNTQTHGKNLCHNVYMRLDRHAMFKYINICVLKREHQRLCLF